MFELAHDGGLSQEVCPGLVAGAGLEGFNGDTKDERVSSFTNIQTPHLQHVLSLLLGQLASADVSELSTPDDCLDGDVARILGDNTLNYPAWPSIIGQLTSSLANCLTAWWGSS